MASVEEIRQALKNVSDPEIGVNIVDLGLVYGVEEKDGNVRITATLTYPGCPLGPQITEDIKRAVSGLQGVRRVDVEVTFDPPWTQDMVTEAGREELNLLRQSMY